MEKNTTISINPKAIRWFGFHFVIGAFMAFGVLALSGFLLSALIRPTDDCDRSRWDRCGMKVVTDEKTGVEYLLSPHGGIIERYTK